MPSNFDPDDLRHLPQVDDEIGSSPATVPAESPGKLARSAKLKLPATKAAAAPKNDAPSEPQENTPHRRVRLKLPPAKTKPLVADADSQPFENDGPLSPTSDSGSIDNERGDPASQGEPDGSETPIFVNSQVTEDQPLTSRERFWRQWEKIGGRSLTLSLALHLVLLLIAGLIVFNYAQDAQVDFMPGGGTRQGEAASQALEQTVTRKRTPWMNRKLPMQRIAVERAMSEITLPEATPTLLDLPMTKDFLSAGQMGSLGFGKSGAGGGFGDGIGTGGKSGVTFTPIMMFGKQINAKRIAVVLDVSRSMTPYLERVVNELDRVARGSTVVLYYGCGILKPEGRLDERVERTQNKDFERFWRIWQGDSALGFSAQDLKKVTFPPDDPLPLPDLFRFLSRRLGTYYLDYNGMEYAQTALLCNEVRGADVIYWFADFEDDVNKRQMKILADNMRLRKQRLYIHPQTHGISFEEVVDSLVKPTGGEVVEPENRIRPSSR